MDAITRACDWLLAQQDPDGAWRKFTYGDLTYTYMAHAACWLAEVGAYLDHQPYLNAARRHLEWVLPHVDSETGWFDKCGFTQQDHQARCAVTHTIAYTIWGVLLLSRILKYDSGMHAAQTATYQIARRLELSRWLPGVLDWRWRPQANYACLTGNAQMALIWFKCNELYEDPALISAACKAIDLVKRAQPMFAKNPGICGGIPGSEPVWGDYIYATVPNWAAKFFIDALLAKQDAFAQLSLPQPAAPTLPPSMPCALPKSEPHSPKPHSAAAPSSLRTILYTHPSSDKVQKLVNAWADWGFRPTAVVVLQELEQNINKRFLDNIQEQGIQGIRRKLLHRSKQSSQGTPIPMLADNLQLDVASFCEQQGISVVNTGSLNSTKTVAAIQALKPDIAINAGAGVFRREILEVPRLGTLNAHMGILPPYRGMNVAEWARLQGDVVGCTVHLIDEGIDTGDILCCRALAVESVTSIAELRKTVDQAQIQLLGKVLHAIYSTGQLPPRHPQKTSEGRQFFIMHPALRAWLDRSLQSAAVNSMNSRTISMQKLTIKTIA